MEVAEHGVHASAARAITVVSTMSGADYQQWEPVFPEWGEARNAFDELVDDLSLPAGAIVADVSLEGVVSNLFEGESDKVVACNNLSGSFVNIINGLASSPFASVPRLHVFCVNFCLAITALNKLTHPRDPKSNRKCKSNLNHMFWI